MVNLNSIETRVDELAGFFLSVNRSSTLSNVDRESAAYGLQKLEFITENLRQYRRKPENTRLKKIHSAFFSVTRGVEAFNDEETHKMFIQKCKGIYQIITELEESIKW